MPSTELLAVVTVGAVPDEDIEVDDIVDGSTGQTAVCVQLRCICGTSASLSARAYPWKQ